MTDLKQKTTRRAQQPTLISRLISEAKAEASNLTPEEALAQYKAERKAHAIEATRAAQEAQRDAKRARLARLYGHAGLPEKFKGRTLDDLEQYDPRIGRVVEISRRYGSNFGRVRELGTCLSLVGNPGTGKTHIASAILELILAQEYVGFFTSMSQILRAYRATFKSDEVTEDDVIARHVEPDLLVIDEIGVAIGNLEKTRSTLFDIFDERYRENKPTLLLGNVTRDELEAFLGERIFRRIQENGGTILACDWASYAEHQQTNRKDHQQ